MEINIFISTTKYPSRGLAEVFGYGAIVEIDGVKRFICETGHGKGESYMGIRGMLQSLRLLRKIVPHGWLNVSVYTTNQTLKAALSDKKICQWKGKSVPALWNEIFPLIDDMDLDVYRIKWHRRKDYLRKGFDESQKRNPLTFQQYCHAEKVIRYIHSRSLSECALLREAV